MSETKYLFYHFEYL